MFESLLMRFSYFTVQNVTLIVCNSALFRALAERGMKQLTNWRVRFTARLKIEENYKKKLRAVNASAIGKIQIHVHQSI